MAIKVPDDAKVVTDQRLTLIRILSTLCADGGRLDELKKAVKASMSGKQQTFAQSDLVIARIASFEGKSYADVRKLYALIESKRITIEQFLDVLCVRTSLLPAILSGAEIKSISRKERGSDYEALYTEFKPGVSVDFDAIETAMVDAAGGRKKAA